MSELKLTVSAEGMTKFAGDLLLGYQDYAKEHPEADYSGLQSDFTGYLKSDAAQEILKSSIRISLRRTEADSIETADSGTLR